MEFTEREAIVKTTNRQMKKNFATAPLEVRATPPISNKPRHPRQMVRLP